ncbi:amidinotransferase [Tissierellia bacterium S5-A11]|nr:amidinotransferase [Tissierellia bacterium S5-A11]
MERKQASHELLMVEPSCFAFNQETAVNNLYQHQDQRPLDQVQKQALEEFNSYVQALRDRGVQVHVFKDSPNPRTPDSIFPNNWFSTHAGGHLAIYPMFAQNRQAEVDKFLPQLEDLLLRDLPQDSIYRKTDYRENRKKSAYLEGTGSMVLDRVHKIAYCALSPRSDQALFERFCQDFGYEAVPFRAYQAGAPIYHTNILMAITSTKALVCLDALVPEDRDRVRERILASGLDLVDLTLDQISQCAGNALEVEGSDGKRFLVCSQGAYQSLRPDQVQALEEDLELLIVHIPTIEYYGGGSARCMLGEIFR